MTACLCFMYYNAVPKNFAMLTGKQLCCSVSLIKLQGFVFLCILRIFIYFEKHLRVVASNYSFTLETDSHLPKKIFFISFNDSPSRMMKNSFYFILKVLFVLKIFKFFLDYLGMQKKRPDQKDKVNFEIYDVTVWLTKNCNTHIAQYLTN